MAQAIVVGGGFPGTSAAQTILELEHGGRVVVIDKSPFCGDNSTKATSGINAAGGRAQRELDIPDTPENFEALALSDAEGPSIVQNLDARRHLWFEPHLIFYEKDQERHQWKSRDQRKGKSVKAEKQARENKKFQLFKPWDISWWTAFLFLLGSAAWIANGVFLFHQPPLREDELQNVEKGTIFVRRMDNVFRSFEQQNIRAS